MVYIPPLFRVDDPKTLHAFMQTYSFATLITSGNEPFVTHLPLLLDRERGPHGTIVGHFARSNPHWRIDHNAHRTVAIFHGPHAYVSPSWYPSNAANVPTWNYAVVHAAGKLAIKDDPDFAKSVLDKTVETYEAARATPWVNPLSPKIYSGLAAAVVPFEMTVEKLEGKFKLSQNRLAEDREGALVGLESSGDSDSIAVAAFARRYLGINSRSSKQ